MKITKIGLLAMAFTLFACGGGGGGESPPPNTQGPYNIGGDVSGLNGSGLQLQVNGSETIDISSDGSYQFPTALQDGDAYSVVVSSDPQNLSQLCGVSNSSGTISGANVNNINVQCDTNSFFIGGAVTNLTGDNLELTINNTETLSINNDGSFQFPTNLLDGSDYSVVVSAQPQTISQQCQITNGVGTLAGSNISNIQVQCVTDSFVIGGTVSGLRSASFELSNAGIEDLIINNDGSFQFVNPVESGSDYSLTVLTQPTDPDQTCSVTNATGTVTDSDIQDIDISCRSLTAVSVSVGNDTSCVILEDDRLKCWGENVSGQLGKGNTENLGDDPDEMGDSLFYVFLDNNAVVSSVETGNHSCAIYDDGILKCWGVNDSGQLGLGNTEQRGDDLLEMQTLSPVDLGSGRTAEQIDVGFKHSCAVLDNGKVKCWGYNSVGQLGYGDVLDRGDAPGEMGDNLVEVELGVPFRTAQQVSTGSTHNCAVLDTNQVKCWGGNNAGQLGYGDTNDRGDEPGEMGINLPLVDLGTGVTAVQVATGNRHSCALLNSGEVKCWGSNVDGRLGLGDTIARGDEPNEMADNLPSVLLGPFAQVTQIVSGTAHTCALLNDGRVKCWGNNSVGQLGLGDINNRGDEPDEMGLILPAVDLGAGRTALSISAGDGHTCARLDTGDVKCWGNNSSGQLGQEHSLEIGSDVNQMGDALPVIDLGSP